MKSIYTSKLFKASKRQDAIKAAAQDPLNGELVAQIATYLDKEYQTRENLGSSPASSDNTSDIDNEDSNELDELNDSLNPHLDDDFNPEDHLMKYPSEDRGASKPHHTPSHKSPSSDSSPEGPEFDDMSAPPEGPSPELGPEPVAESSKINGTSVMAHHDIEVDVLKGTLNSQDKTAGVNRIMTKDHELWIYYNDSINLNNIMADVIEYLNAAGMNLLEFNRLARSDNAIVFQINHDDTAKIDPIADTSETK